MAKVSGRNTRLLIKDNTAASRDISGKANTGSISFTSEEVDVTGFGASYRERVADALKDWSVEIAGFFDGAASSIDETLYGIMAACTSVCFAPAGCANGKVVYSGCAILQDYSVEAAVDGGVTFSATFMAASDLNRTTV